MQVVILAGGMGTRLRAISGNRPKPLVEINGVPLLDYMLTHISKSSHTQVLVLAGYEGSQIEKFCGDGSKWGLTLRTIIEPKPVGTAGAVLGAIDLIEDNFLLLYGDTLVNFDIDRMINFHDKFKPSATLFLHPNDHPHDSDLVELDEAQVIRKFHSYPHPSDTSYPNLVNAGAYIIEKSSILVVNNLQPNPDFGRDLFPKMLEENLRLMGYISPEYIKDAGTPERLFKVSKDILSGRVENSSLSIPRPAVFIDRDGTLIKDVNHLSKADDLKVFKGVSESLSLLNQSGLRTILITNQPVIARGDCDELELKNIHNRLESSLGIDSAFLDRIYYCPHHPDKGFVGERLDLKIDCNCRKPKIGLIERAKIDLNINLDDSWLIGDSTTDLMTAKNSGVRSILVRTGNAGRDEKWPCLPDFEVPDFSAAVNFILNRWPILEAKSDELIEDIFPGDLILIGGNSRSGKSSWASALKYTLMKKNIPAIVIPLDCCLRSEKDRKGNTVLDRYNLEAAKKIILSAQMSIGKIKLPKYDKYKRLSISDGVEIEAQIGAVLIIEGVPALMDEELRKLATKKIYIERNEKDRYLAVGNEYRIRGWNENEISKLLNARAFEEFPSVEESKVFADINLKN